MNRAGAFALLLCAATLAAAAPPPPAPLSGTVRDAAGKPLAGAMVLVADVADERAVAAASSATDGRWRITGLPPGRYRVTASKSGFTAAAGPASTTVPGGAPIDLVLAARPAPPAPPAAKRIAPEEVPASCERQAFADDLAVQRYLNDLPRAGREILAVLGPGGAEGCTFVTRAATGPAPAYVALPVYEAPDDARLAARLAEQKGRTFVGMCVLREGLYALVFRAGR